MACLCRNSATAIAPHEFHFTAAGNPQPSWREVHSMLNLRHHFYSLVSVNSLTAKRSWLCKTALSMIVTVLVVCGFHSKAEAADVILDYSFGTGGVVVNPLDSVGIDMALQPDGKIVVAGTVAPYGIAFRLARYNSNGSLDTTFGTGGIVTTTFPNQSQYAAAYSVVIQPDGKIVAGGYVRTFPSSLAYDFALVRYNPDGSLDNTFGTGGKVVADINGNYDLIEDVALQADGKIICVGYAYAVNNQPQYELAMIRYNSNGVEDTSFGTLGRVVSTTTYGAKAYSVVVQPDGKIVVGGSIIIINTIDDFLIARYNTNGNLDTGFGTNGQVIIDFGSNTDTLKEVALQPDGKIIAAGNKPSSLIMARLNPDGSIDSGFTPPQGEVFSVHAMVVQADGKILLGGVTSDPQGQGDFALRRLNSNGTLDTTFDGDGRESVGLGNISNDYLYALAVLPDGKILAAGTASGYTSNSSYTGFALARFQTTPRAAAKAYDFDGDGKADHAIFRPSNGTWYIRQSSNGSLYALKWGQNGDMPEPGDFDGDSRNDLVVFRDGLWYLNTFATLNASGMQFGTTGDIPVAADYDGDAKADFAVFRPSSGTWYILRSSDSVVQAIQLGTAGDKPVPGDYNADGRADVAVWRPSTGTWYTSLNPATNYDAFVWGQNGDIAVPGDYDGDGKYDRAIFRPSTATWWILNSSNGGYLEQQFGAGTDMPVPADYDGDGRTNIAVFRPSTGRWYTSLDVSTNYGEQLWGQAGDIPVESANVP
jgi:uncharacterized delta-60 repeat protein